MAENLIMAAGSIVFAVLFTFLTFVFLTVILSFFRKDHYPEYEPKISIIVPCYNEEENIAKCLDGIYSLDYPEQKLEVLVVDDGSTDNTQKILKDYRKKHKGLKIVKGKHEGKSPTLTLGGKKASNEIILSLDADTVLDKECLKKLVRPFFDKKVGLVNGSCIASNSNSLISIFQKVEYHHNNLLRRSFSALFKTGIWFFGAFVCYRKKVLEEIGWFKKDTLTEDLDTALEIYSAGYKTINVHDAHGYTVVPATLSGFIKQRVRWFAGGLQALHKNRSLFSAKSSPSILFVFINQYWWAFYAVISFPIIAYQVLYWLPYNMESPFAVFIYLFRWFSLLGPFYVIYKIPEWGISLYSIFGVLSGVISMLLLVKAVYLFKDKLHLKNAFGIFFYFPYTIILNTIAVISLIKLIFLNEKHFKR